MEWWGIGRRFVLLGVLAVAVIAGAIPSTGFAQENDESSPRSVGGNTFRVYAHPEGLVGHTTANGHVIQPDDFFVALPCWCALSSLGGNEFEVRVEYQGESLVLPVWDVGPWNVEDNYWDAQNDRTWSGLPQGLPQAEAAYYDNFNGGLDGWGREVQSPAGIDIADGAFAALGMTTSDWVDVTFLWLEPDRDAVVQQLPPLPAQFNDIQTRWWDERPPLGSVEQVDDDRFGYIVETGHHVPNEILDYWYQHGGWRALGLPISEFFRQVYEDGSVEFVQYFERSILTMYWPDDGGPGVVEAKPLGYETYIEPAALDPVPPFDPDDWATYFPATGHSLGGGFRTFWNAHGGEAVFGAPLSEEWESVSRDGERVVYQVFERARFEWWPERAGDPTRDDITLGLLTVELLERAGWSTIDE